MSTTLKQQLRGEFLGRRAHSTPQQWQQKSQQIRNNLRNFPLLQQAKTVLTYLSFKQEADLSPLYEEIKINWGIPRCAGKNLTWHHWGQSLHQGKYGILEPSKDSPQIYATEVDLMLIPALACDTWGYRLGYGGGYYDRLLNAPEWQNITTVGIVFHDAYVDELPHDSWDIPLDYIITDKIKFKTPCIKSRH